MGNGIVKTVERNITYKKEISIVAKLTIYREKNMNNLGEIQKEQIMSFLRRNGEMTRQDAFFHLGIANPTARITELRQAGEKIATRIEYGVNQFGQPTHWAVWYLIIPPVQLTMEGF